MADELALQAIGGDQRLVPFHQRALVLLGGGDIEEGQQGGAIRQRRGGEIDHRAVRANHLAFDGVALIGNGGNGAIDPHPGALIVVQRTRVTDELINVRLTGENVVRQVPDCCEGLVGQLETAIGGEHRNAFLQAIQRFALHIDEGVIAALQLVAFGHVVIETRHAAILPLHGGDAQHAAVGQMPGAVEFLAGAVAIEQFDLPIAVIDHRGQAGIFAQAVEDFAVGRMRGEPRGVEPPQPLERGVEEAQPLILVEDGDAGGHAVQRAIVGGDLPFKFTLRGLQRGDVDGGRSRRFVQRNDDDFMRFALATDDQRQALLVGVMFGQRTLHGGALAGFQQFDLTIAHFRFVGRFDGGDVGFVDPIDTPAGAEPYRHRQGVEQGAAGTDIAGKLAMLVDDAQQVALIAGDIAQAQDGAGASGAAVSFQMPAGGGLEQQIERSPVRKQAVQAGFERFR